MSSEPPSFSTGDFAKAWQDFTAPSGLTEFCQGWIAILGSQVEHSKAAVLLLSKGSGGDFSPAAIWPDPGCDVNYLAAAAQLALSERKPIIVGPDSSSPPMRGQAAYIGYPLEFDSRPRGVVVLHISANGINGLQADLRAIHWASAWLMTHFYQQKITERDARLSGLTTAADMLAATLQDRRFGPSAVAVVNELCTRLDCDRVSLGVERHGSVEVKAISHTAIFDRKSDLVRLISQAMDEVIDLDVALVVPQSEDEDLGAIAHAEAARDLQVAAICSVPLIDGGHAFGVVMLERTSGTSFSAAEVELCKTLGLLLGPVLALKLRDEMGLVARLSGATRQGLQALFGPHHPGLKLLTVVMSLLLVFFALFTTDHRVSARTVVEGEIQRAATAPFDGFIAESMVRAGDQVNKGQIMLRLDTRDLRLEQTRWTSERDQAVRKYRVAQAAQDRGTMAVLAAQVNQAEAQLRLVDERLARHSIEAPFDGVVVSGDLSQLLGTPVEQGKVLFEVAPQNRFRVILRVDERDIGFLNVGQRGELLLSGLPNEVLNFSVRQITPVSSTEDGRNHFRVEAQLEGAPTRLRPGMEGVGKVLVGRERLIWIWTHGMTDWLRLTLWDWMP